jgi:hypothetical protein
MTAFNLNHRPPSAARFPESSRHPRLQKNQPERARCCLAFPCRVRGRQCSHRRGYVTRNTESGTRPRTTDSVLNASTPREIEAAFATLDLRRRQFIRLLGGAAAAWPLAAHAQQPAIPTIGFVRITTPQDSAHLVAAFRRGLAENGCVEGQNVTIEYRYALNQVGRLPAIMADLVGRPVSVLAATGGTISARAAKAATIITLLIAARPPRRRRGASRGSCRRSARDAGDGRCR